MVEAEKVYEGFTYFMTAAMCVFIIYTIVVLLVREPSTSTASNVNKIVEMNDVDVDTTTLQTGQVLKFNNVLQKFQASEAVIVDTAAVTPITGTMTYSTTDGSNVDTSVDYDVQVYDNLVCYKFTITVTTFNGSIGGPTSNAFDMNDVPALAALIPSQTQGTSTYVLRDGFTFASPIMFWLEPDGIGNLSEILGAGTGRPNGDVVVVVGQYSLPPPA